MCSMKKKLYIKRERFLTWFKCDLESLMGLEKSPEEYFLMEGYTPKYLVENPEIMDEQDCEVDFSEYFVELI